MISAGRLGAPWLDRVASNGYPSLAQIGGHALTSIFFDALEADIEQLERINAAVAQSPIPLHDAKGKAIAPRRLSVVDAEPWTRRDRGAAPRRAATAGPIFPARHRCHRRSGSSLASYLLFERAYTRALIRLGCADAMARRGDIMALLAGSGASTRDD